MKRDQDPAAQMFREELGAEVVAEHPNLPMPSIERGVTERGLWEVCEPIIEQAETHDELDDLELQADMVIAKVRALHENVTEAEKVKRIIERRRGELLGPRHSGRRQPVTRVGEVPDVSAMTLSRWRAIPRDWSGVIRPWLTTATEARQVTQAAVLRLLRPHPDDAHVTHERRVLFRCSCGRSWPCPVAPGRESGQARHEDAPEHEVVVGNSRTLADGIRVDELQLPEPGANEPPEREQARREDGPGADPSTPMRRSPRR